MKKYLALILALLMVFSLAACGVSNESPKTETTTAASSGIRLFNGKIEIATPLENAAKAYEAATGKHVEIESLGGGVDLQATLKQYYQAGNMPDIFVFEGKPDLANWTGMVVDMSDQAWAKDTDAGFVDESGALVGFPYTTEAIGLAYNKSILEKAGVDPASITGPASMKAAFEAIDAKKADLGITAVVGYCAEASSLYWSTGQHLFGQYLDAGLARDDTTYYDMLMDGGKLDAARFADFAKMVALFNQYSDPALLVSGTYDQQVQGFAAGKYAFVTQGSWIGASMTSAYASDYEAAGKFECGYVPYAFQDGIDTILTNAPSHWAVYKDGKVAEAEEFLNWLAKDGQQIMVQEAGCVSPFKSCTVVANDPFAGPISQYASAGKTSAWHWMGQPSNLAQDYTGVVFQQFAMGQLDTDGFISTMTKVIPQCIQ